MENRIDLMKPGASAFGHGLATASSAGDEALKGIYSGAAELEYASASPLFLQGSAPGKVFLVKRGLIKLIRVSEDGQELIVGLKAPGTILGAASAIVQKPHPFSAVTLTRCTICRVPLTVFLDLARTDPKLSWYLHQLHSREVYDQARQLAELRCLSARQRLEQLLWQIVTATEAKLDDGPVKLHLPLKYWEIAQLIGVTPEHLSRVMRQLEDEGAMRRENGALVVNKFNMLYHSTTP